MDWDDIEARLRLIESVGHEEYNRRMKAHLEQDCVSTVNGHGILPVNTRFGRLFRVMGTDSAFRTQKEAEDYAATH